jgi:antitoxin ParD1/3/4
MAKDNRDKTFMTPHRINARLSGLLADHVAHVVGPDGLYETPSEYIRALIRQDMAQSTAHIYGKIREGLEDMAQGRILKPHGTWEQDKPTTNTPS